MTDTKALVLSVLADGAWHTLHEIRAAFAADGRRDPHDLFTVVNKLRRAGTVEDRGGWGKTGADWHGTYGVRLTQATAPLAGMGG